MLTNLNETEVKVLAKCLFRAVVNQFSKFNVRRPEDLRYFTQELLWDQLVSNFSIRQAMHTLSLMKTVAGWHLDLEEIFTLSEINGIHGQIGKALDYLLPKNQDQS